MKPIISVVIPIYNTDKYIRKCIDSLLSQTLQNIEIICVDDLSPDDSNKIVQEYVAHDNRVKLIKHEKNLGQGGARNTGILAAKSDFITSVDSDDSVAPNMLEKLWEASEFGLYDVTCCGFIRVTEAGEEISRRIFEPKVIDNLDNNINIFTVTNPAVWNKLWRKTLFIDNDIFFPNKIYYQDMATIPLLLANANKIKFIDECLYYYLVREGSVTTSYSPKHILDYFKVYEILYGSLVKHGLQDKCLDDLMNNVSEGMRFHSSNVIESSMPEQDKNQYLRHMLMLKISFFELHKKLIKKNRNDLLDHLKFSTSIDDISSEQVELTNVEKNVTYVKSRELKSWQKRGSKVFGFVFQKQILRPQQIKLCKDPVSFFNDSKNNFTRFVGRLLKII